MVKVTIKWNKNVYNDVELDTSAPVSAFRQTLQTLTSVPVERQKLMAKGAWKGMLKDTEDLSACKLKEGHTVMLMGTAEVLEKPKEEVKFLEDMTTGRTP